MLIPMAECGYHHDGPDGVVYIGRLGRFRKSLNWARDRLPELHKKRAAFAADGSLHLHLVDQDIASLERAIEEAEWLASQQVVLP